MSKKDEYKTNIGNAERRFFTSPVTIEKRADGEENKPATIEGMAALFNVRTTIYDWFEEEVLPGAFDDVLNDDVRCLLNHDPNFVLARSKEGKGTLELFVNDKGLGYRYETPKRSYAQDLEDAIDTGDVSGSSFQFKIKEQKWISREGELDLRQIVKFEKLYDVSPVTFPAYPEADVAKRSHDAYISASKENTEQRKLSVYEAQVLINKNNS